MTSRKNQLIWIVVCFTFKTFGQLTPAACVHSSGARYFLDAYLASMGACNCERAPVFLNDFQNCNTEPYILEFEDNFDGDSLDLEKWELAPGRQGAQAGDQRIEVATLENVALSNGICHIIARKEKVKKRSVNWYSDEHIVEDGKKNLREYDYTCSILFTKRKFFYGKFEIRCRMPAGNGFWPAFWLYGGERGNEIDVFDNYGGSTKIITSIGHDFDGNRKASGCNDTKRGYDLTQWHTFTCVFEYDQIVFLIDGDPFRVIYRVVTPAREPVSCGDNVGSGTYYQLKAFPVEPMNLIFNMALISKNGPGNSSPVDETTPFPSSFDVDYVRAWERKSAAVIIFPNPTYDNLSIFTNNLNTGTVEVRDARGLLLFEQVFNSSSFVIGVATLAPGFYYVIIRYNGGIKTRKFLKG